MGNLFGLNYLFDEFGNMRILDSDSKVTQRVKRDWNILSDMEFFNRYSASKELYRKRVIRYKDPYMKSPLAIIGKFLEKHT